MPPKIKARMGDVVDITFRLKYKRSEVDRLPDRENWAAYMLVLLPHNAADDVIPAAADHSDDWPFASERCPSGISWPLPENLEAAYTPPAVKEDDQEVKAAFWINPDFGVSKKGKPLFKPGLACEVWLAYCNQNLESRSALRKARTHLVATVEIVSTEGVAADGSDGDTGWAVFKKGSAGTA